jgi:uracil-DNA glycosylase family 4
MSSELDSWLRYYRDLGFTHLYRRDPPSTIQAGFHLDERNEIQLQNMKKTISPTPAAPATIEVATSTAASPVPPKTPDLFRVVAPPETLEAIREDLGDCRRCKLSMGRKKIVFGSGNPKAQLVFVGEGPGADEDEQGLPFVGRAGQLLTDMIEKGMNIPRPEVYICNIVKCRPPQNRKPEKDEVAECRQFVERQIDAIQPRVICALGATAAETMLDTRESMGKLRGRKFEFHGIPLLVTYHPAYLLRDPTKKRDTWEDLKMVLTYLKM